MIIEVEGIKAENFARLVDFVSQQEIAVPSAIDVDTDEKYFTDPIETVSVIKISDIKHNPKLKTFGCKIIIFKLAEIKLISTVKIPNFNIKDINKARTAGGVKIDLDIPRHMIDGILNSIDLFTV